MANLGSANGQYQQGSAPDPAAIKTASDVAGIRDLKKAGAGLVWVWKGWVQRGVVTVVAAEGGTGKTRWAADLVRRVRHRLPWPEGADRAGWEGETVALWVVSDQHHSEMVTLCESFGIDDCVKVNAHPEDPYGGTGLETAEDFALLEKRTAVVKPQFVIVDTVGNATPLNLSKQEDAKAFYAPLQVLARKQNVAVLCLTHLNAGGTVLGRRGVEKARTVIRMTAADIADVGCPRRLEVVKSNSPYPKPLGVVMGDHGNEYNADPPPAPGGEMAALGRPPTEVRECMEMLAEMLADEPKRLADIRAEADRRGMSPPTLYRAKAALKIVEMKVGKSKFWCRSGGVPDELEE